ncbi:MAG TPA: FeoB-associated Cys-rich membrane protein [Candidatus Anaerobutyricum faecale]|nr:FeoB-associated Cys-rich membrane protein [Eubacterium sp. An11]OUQ69337.1 hypothetical protein B5E53_04360 [Eubacterium sp. An11]HJC31448.1 FeoB-associated Cys-rich membrane protein [Candidatus Anaerobutyricum faecale]
MIADILILTLVIGYCMFLVCRRHKNKKNSKPTGCAGCGKCSSYFQIEIGSNCGCKRK